MAVGFENGSVMLFKGDVTRDRYESTIQILILKSVGSLICCGFYVYTDVSKKNKNRKWQRILRTMRFNIKNTLDVW